MTTPYVVEKDGKQYMYRATSRYSPEKKGPVAITEYMGVVIDGVLKPKRGYFYDPETGEFGRIDGTIDAPSPSAKISTLRFGDVYFLMALQKRLCILEDLEAAFGLETGRTIMAVCFAYMIEPAALMHMEDIIERRCILQTLGLDEDTDVSSPRMSELTNRIGSSPAKMDEFFRRRISGSSGEYVFDLTSESTYSSSNQDAQWGRNKDGDHLRQINIGLVTDRLGHPLMFYVYPGSVADVTTIRRMVDDVRRLGGEDSTLVMDRGFVSPKSIYCLMEEGMDFVMPIVMGDNKVVKSLVTAMLGLVGKVGSTVVYNDRSYTVLERQLGVRRMKGARKTERDTVWEDPDGYDLVLDTDEDFVSCDHKLDVFVFRDTESAGGETAGMDVALRNIMNELEGERPRDPKKRFAKVAGSYASMLDVTMVDGRMHLEIKQNAHTFAANRKGVFIMITPADKDRTWDQVLRCYECRDIVEDVFMEDKSQGDGRRPRSGDRQTVIGRTFIRMVSMIMKMEMVNRISEYSKDKKVKTKDKPRNIGRQTPESLLSTLSTIEIVRGTGWEELTEVTKECRLIYRMFDIGPPKGFKR